MSVGQIVELPRDVNEEVSALVGDLFDHHTEALVLGVTPDEAGGKPRITIYSKAPEEGGTLFPYLKELLAELVNRHEQAAARRLTPGIDA